MEQRKIDVIVAVFNVEHYLQECITSLLNQTVPLRIIIVNDGSTDHSGQIAQQFASDFPQNITYIEQENAGLSAARNKGMKYADAQYIAFMDSDDWVSDDYYEKMLQTIEATKADIVCSDITFVYPSGVTARKAAHHLPEKLRGNCITTQDQAYPSYIISIFPMVQNKLWRRDLLGDAFRFLEGRQYEDLDFFYRVYPHTQAIAFTSSGTFYYRQREDSIVKTSDDKILDIIPVFEHIMAYYQTEHLDALYQKEIDYLLIRNALVASSKRLAYSRNYRFIRKNLGILFHFVETSVPDWRQNPYIQPPTLRHFFIKSFSRATLGLHAILLCIISFFLKK